MDEEMHQEQHIVIRHTPASSNSAHFKLGHKHQNLHPSYCEGTVSDIERMQQILENDPNALHRCGYLDNKTECYVWDPPLYAACESLHKECVAFLLDAGARIDQESKTDRSIVDYVLSSRNVMQNENEILDIFILILQKCNTTQRLYKQEHMMYNDMIHIILEGAVKPLKLLLESGEFHANVKNLDSTLIERNSPFGAALESFNIPAMKLLVLHGVKIANYIRWGHGRLSLPVYIIQLYEDPSLALRAVKIFHNFGGSLKTTQHLQETDSELTIMQAVQQKQDKIWSEEQKCELEKIIDIPLKLVELCRFSLWKYFGTRYWQSIDKLEIPQEVNSFLHLDNH